MPGKSKQKDAKDEVIKDVKEDGKKGATKAEKMEVDFVKVDAKKEKKDAAVKTPKSFRPSFTPLVYPGKGIRMGQIAGCFINGIEVLIL